MSKIEMNLTLTLSIPEEGINVNGLLFGLKKMSSQIMLGILKILFQAIEDRAITELKETVPHRFIRYGKQKARTLKTSFGPLKYAFSRVKNLDTNHIRIPLREVLKVPKYRRYQDESMEPGIGLAVHLSYGRSDKEVDRILGSSSSRWTLWRRLGEFSDQRCAFRDMKKIPYVFLLVDGTGVHLQESGGRDVGQKRMRWAMASTGVNQPFDIVGIWVDKSWKQIAQDLRERLDYDKLQVLISDGGPGIEFHLLEEGMRHQRCIFHAKRDFPFILFQDGLKKAQQKELKDAFNRIPALTFSKAHVETLTHQDRSHVIKICKRTEKSFEELIQLLDPSKYPKARAYVQNLAGSVSLFFYWWLENNEWIPTTSNLIENRFSMVKNRIKRIGKRWSDKGLLRWLMVVIQKIFTPENWNSLWNQFLDINRPLEFMNLNIKYSWL